MRRSCSAAVSDCGRAYDGRFAYLFVAVRDDDLVYPRTPGEMPYGDRVVIATEPSPGIVRWLLLGTGAPGTFRAQETAPDLFATTGRPTTPACSARGRRRPTATRSSCACR